MTAVPSCARGRELVAMLLRQIARDRGTSVGIVRVRYGLDPDNVAPLSLIPDMSETLCALTQPSESVRPNRRS